MPLARPSAPRADPVILETAPVLTKPVEVVNRAEEDEDPPFDADEAYRKVEREVEAARAQCLKEYRKMVEDTREVSLRKLITQASGVALFDELCARVDVNQEMADLLPQWKDLAEALQVDALRTQWVQACVRPKEGLTRAILEIYMSDGGTLGEVLEALLRLECLQILEKLKPKVRAYLKEAQFASSTDEDLDLKKNDRFFSIISTLMSVFGGDDPCADIQKYSAGLKSLKCSSSSAAQIDFNNLNTDVIAHNVLVTSGNGEGTASCDPNPKVLERLDLSFDPQKHMLSKDKLWDVDKDAKESITCRLLLVFSDDGVAAAQDIYDRLQGFEYEGVTADVFRMNETSLWYELLVNPEACCMKWVSEADYVVPVLTPNFLREIHNNRSNADSGNLLPTSPMLNRLVYQLMRARYAEAGCRNTMVRPVIPAEFNAVVSVDKVVRLDPILRLVSVPTDGDRLEKRARGMLAEVKKRSLA